MAPDKNYGMCGSAEIADPKSLGKQMDVRTLPTIFRSKRGDNDKRRGEVESIKSAHRRESVKVPGFLKVNWMEIPMRGEDRGGGGGNY